MHELLRNSRAGWLHYTDNGKFAALLLVVLLFLWLRGGRKHKELLIYTTIGTVLCILPITAMLLQKYQTQFYDYEWIWNYVPVTIMLAYGITIFLFNRWKRYKQEVQQKGNTVTRKLFWENIAITAGVLAVVLLCGCLGNPVFRAEEETQERQQAQIVLEVLTEQMMLRENMPTASGQMDVAQKLVLWAPREVMAYARAYDGNIRLIYGRNMWDKALMGYSYENYGDVEESLYQWMRSVEEKPDQTPEEFLEGGLPCVEAALERGVNCIMLPGDTAKESIKGLEKAVEHKAELVEGYYVFLLTDKKEMTE